MFSKRFKRKSSKKLLIFSAFTVILILVFLVFGSNLFKVNTVDITLNKINCVTIKELKAEVQINDQNIFFVSAKKILGITQNKYPCIKQLLVHPTVPSKVNLEFVGREAVLSFKPAQLEEASISAILSQFQKISTPSAQATSLASQSANQFLVDNDGVVFAQTFETLYIPSILFWDSNLKIGTKLEYKQVADLLSIFDRLKALNLPILEVRIYSSGNMLVQSSNIIIFNLNRDIQNQLAALQLILDKAKIDEENMVFIDLRFDKPVVKYAPRSK